MQVTCLAISECGSLLASGQKAPIGSTAVIILWDLNSGREVRRMELHKVCMRLLPFNVWAAQSAGSSSFSVCRAACRTWTSGAQTASPR